MKVLHIVPSYKPAYLYGGTITAVAMLCESQVQQGADVHVFTTTANGAAELPKGEREIDGVLVRYFPRLTKDHTHFSPALLRQLRRTIHQYDAVHLHSWWNLVTIPALLICRQKGVRPLFSPHGMLGSYSLQNRSGQVKLRFHEWIGKSLLQHSLLHATAPQEAKEGQALVDDWETIVIPNIVELPEQRLLSQRVANDVFTIVFLSRIHHKKGLEYLFEALAKVEFSFRLRIAGGGDVDYIDALKVLAKQLKIDPNIDWVGWLDGAAKYQLLQQADLCALTSYNENFAMVVIESLAMGTPVLLSDQVGLGQYVNDNQLGWVIPQQVEQIATTLHYIHRYPAELEAIRQRATTTIYQDFSPSSLAQQYLEAYPK
jgi:glycosyltransferase involved in cell wall biosynthesis